VDKPDPPKFKQGWIEIFLQILVRINFWPSPPRTQLTWVEPVVSRVGSPTHL